MFTVSKLLEQIPSESSVEQKRLEKILKFTKKSDKKKLDIAIDALTKIGVIEKNDENNLSKNQNMNLIQARLRCSSKGYCFAVRDDGDDDIYIRDQNLNHAWNGDRVLVKITREGVRRRSAEGSIQCILERGPSRLLALLQMEEDQIIANPLDDRLLETVMLDEADKKYFINDHDENLVELNIDQYPVAQHPAKGHVIRSLSLKDGLAGDIEILLTKTNLQRRLDTPRSTLKQPITKNRLDLTDQQSIILQGWEGDNAPIPQAFHAEPHNGGIRLWIHTPAVSELINFGGSFELWLREIAESHCLGNSWNCYLPEALINKAIFKESASCNSVSLRIDLDNSGESYDWQFHLTTIKPQVTITTEHLVTLSKRRTNSKTIPASLKKYKDYLNTIQNILFASKLINEKEANNGLINLDLRVPEIETLGDLRHEDLELSNKQWITPFDINNPNSVIATLTRESNRIYLSHANSLKLPAIMLQSEPIDNNNINELAKTALALDLSIELDEEGYVSPSNLSKLFEKNLHKRVLQKLLRYSLPEPKIKLNYLEEIANLFEEAPSQQLDGSSINASAPWTSISEHYYSLLNQHVLVLLLAEGKDRPTARHKKRVELGKKDASNEISWQIINNSVQGNLIKIFTPSLIYHLNSKLNQSKLLTKSIISMSQAREAEPFVGQELEAIVTGVQSYGFFAEIKESQAEGLVHVSTLNDDWYEYRSRQNLLVGRKSKATYKLGDNVNVKILKVDVLRNQIDLEVVNAEVNDTYKAESSDERLKTTIRDESIFEEE